MTVQTKLQVIDADAHVVETEITWDYLEPAEEKYRPVMVPSGDDPSRGAYVVDGISAPAMRRKFTDEQIKELSRVANRDMATPEAARQMTDIGLRLKHMDELGIDIQVLFPTIWLTNFATDPDAEAALARAWNRWLIDIWKAGKGRLRWACVVPTLLIGEAIAQMRIAKENGAVGVFMRPFEGERIMTDPYFHPLYEEAERLDLAMTVHISNGNPANTLFYIDAHIAIGTKGFAITRVPAVMGCMFLLMSEIPALFPKLRWGFIESTAQWMPWVHNEAARRYASVGKPVPDDLFRQCNIFVTCQDDDDLPWILRYAGEHTLMTGTDYGHTDPAAKIDAISQFRARTDVGDATKARILQDNPKTLYNV
jgi:predicted TIM-barrel fold metal-dependent hydrolase